MLFINFSSYPTVTTLRMVHIQARLMDAQILNVVQDFVVRTQNMTFEKKIRDRKVISNPVNIIHDDFDDASKVDFFTSTDCETYLRRYI